MKEASPIAASLYKLVPAEIKQYSLYRKLTGEAIKMLKQVIEVTLITESLKKKYIDPLLEATEKRSVKKLDEAAENHGREKGMIDFSRYPMGPSKVRSIRSRRRYHVQQGIEKKQISAGNHLPIETDPPLQAGINGSEYSKVFKEPDRTKEPESKSTPRIKTKDGLIYLGRMPECKEIKIWLRSWVVEV